MKTQQWNKIVSFTIIFSILKSAISMLSIFFIGQLIQVSYEGNKAKLFIWLTISIILFLLNAVINFVEKYISSKMIPVHYHQTRMLFLNNFFKLIQKKLFKKGQINNAVKNDIPSIISASIKSISSITYSITTLVLMLGILIWMHWILALTAISCIFIFAIFPLIIKTKLETLNLSYSKNYELFYGRSMEQNKNKEQYLFTRKLGDYYSKMLEKIEIYGNKKNKINLFINIYWQLFYLLAELIFILPIIVGSILYGQHNIGAGAIAMLVLLSEKILSVGDDISDGLNSFFSIKKIKRKYENHNIVEIKKITFKNVLPIYDKELGLKAKNIKVSKGNKLLFIGKNGTGKSSLLNIIDTSQKYHGLITINDKKTKNINDFFLSRPHKTSTMFETIHELEECISINENIIYKNIKKLIIAGTKLGDDSVINSQGEKQLLSLLHTLANEPKIVILDETLTSVDDQLKKQIYKSLLNYENLSLILVDHTLDKLWEELFHEIISF